MPAVSVRSLSKCFRLSHAGPQTIKDTVLGGLRRGWPRRQMRWALRDVSFELESGQWLGIVGHNGAGKSTLLRLLCGLGRPTSGAIAVAGRIGGILELGGGFHPDLTGRENLLTAGLLNGLSRDEVRAREAGIIAFAELEHAIDAPIRTYSSGMYLRLAFSVALELDPDILVIDELLAVGDERFQQKCLERIRAYKSAGKTIVFTSHDPEQIQRLCDQVLVLEDGRSVLQGDPGTALRHYQDLLRQRSERRAAQMEDPSPTRLEPAHGSRFGTQEASIEEVQLSDADGQPVHALPSGHGATVQMRYRLLRPLPDMILTVGIFNDNHLKCFEATIPSVRSLLGDLPPAGWLRCQLPTVPLLPGAYFVNVGLYPPGWEFVYDYHWQMHPLQIVGGLVGPGSISGVVALQPAWTGGAGDAIPFSSRRALSRARLRQWRRDE